MTIKPITKYTENGISDHLPMAPISCKHTTTSMLWDQRQCSGPTDVGRPNTISYKSKNHVRTSSTDQHCKNQNELNSPKQR